MGAVLRTSYLPTNTTITGAHYRKVFVQLGQSIKNKTFFRDKLSRKTFLLRQNAPTPISFCTSGYNGNVPVIFLITLRILQTLPTVTFPSPSVEEARETTPTLQRR